MSEGRHGISAQTWFDYLEGAVAGPERTKLDAHLDACAECRRLHLQIRDWERVIQDEAERVTAAFNRTPDEIAALASSALGRIRRSEPQALAASSSEFSEAVLFLLAVLDPLCGAGAARNAVRLATERSGALAHWGLFVHNLSETIGAVYGEQARTLVQSVAGRVASC